ncbi:MAG: phosphonate ABC transporter, permease protein PhnE [Gemmatimonadota bacterium]
MTEGAARSWQRPSRLRGARAWLLSGLVAAYLVGAAVTIDVDAARIVEGAGRAADFFGGLLRPDFLTRGVEIRSGLVESLAMTLVSTAIGFTLSIPLGLGAARNVVPSPVYSACRALLAVFRAFHPVLVAIVFVAMFGFGAFAGVMTLVVATVGFIGKLLAEAVEEIDPAPLEALTVVGASWPTRIVFAVLPQVMPRILGLSLYRLDINFRESAIIGLVGAGGIGATLITAFARYEFESVSAILLLIVAILFIGELVSGRIRRGLL